MGVFKEGGRWFPWRLVLGLLLMLMTSPAWAAPTVTGYGPPDGGAASTGTTVTATFSEPMNAATITPGSFTLSRFVGFKAMAGGGSHTVALRNDGTVVAWGATRQPNLSGVVAVAAGSDHWAALKSDGTVVTWADYAEVPAGLSGVTAIAAGGGKTIALKSNGTVVAWGTEYSYSEPEIEMDYYLGAAEAVPAGLSGVIAVSAGQSHSVALKNNGTVVAWGLNTSGQTSVPAGLSGVVAIAAGGVHTVALKNDGTLVTWGGGVTVPAGLSGVKAIAAGLYHTVALKNDGTVVAWGDNTWGQVTVPAGLSGVVAIAAGENHTLAVKQDGTAVMWGDNRHSQIQLPPALSGVTALATKGGSSAIVKHDGTVAAWGFNVYGANTVPAGLSGVVAVATNTAEALALKKEGTLTKWGVGYQPPAGLSGVAAIAAGGNLALKKDGTVVYWGPSPVLDCDEVDCDQVTDPASLTGVVAVATGSSHGVALKSDGKVACWGSGQYWYDDPCAVPSGLSGVVAIAAGPNSNTLAVKSDGTVVAWGNNEYGKNNVPAGLTGVVAVDAGEYHSVALKSDGTVVTWGGIEAGESTPPAGLSGVIAIAAGHRQTMALRKDGTVVAWGWQGPTASATSPYEAAVEGTVTYDPNSNTATFTPRLPLDPGVTYYANLTGARSSSGAYLANDVRWSFRAQQGGKLSQTITVTQPAPAQAMCDSSFTVKATASSGLPVTITASGACSASTTTNSALIVMGSSGTCNVYYNQAGNASYNAAPQVVSITALDLRMQTIDFPAPPEKTYGDPSFPISATASSGLPVTFTSATPAVCTVTGSLLTLVGAGDCTITASQGGDSYCCAATPVTRTFYVAPGGVHHFDLQLASGAKTAGAGFGITVTARNILNQPVTSYAGAVTLSTTAGSITPAGAASFTAGVWSGAVAVTRAGDAKTITAVDQSGKSGTSAPFTVDPGKAVTFTVSSPTRATTGAPFYVTVTAKDSYDNTATGYLGRVHFTSSDPTPSLPADFQFLAADKGARLFSVTLNTSGDQTVTATDTLDGTVSGTSAPIAVNSDANHRLRLTTTSSTTAGKALDVTVTVEDLNGNKVTDYRGTVRFTSTDYQASLPANYTFSAADNGSRTFSLTLRTAGLRAVTAIDTQLSVVRGTSGSIRVFPAEAQKLGFGQQPTTTMAGQIIAPVKVLVLDAYGNQVTDSTAAITLALGANPAGGTLSGTTTRNAVGGLATFDDLSINKAGNGYTVVASSNLLTGATSSFFNILHGAFTRFSFSTIGTQTHGYPFGITITALDNNDNTVTDFTESARLTVSAGSAISPVYTGAFSGGIWTGSVTVTGAGSGRTITATRLVGTESGVSGAFAVNKANQTITVTKPAPGTAEDRSSFQVSATASSGAGVAITATGVCTGGGTGSAWITMTSGSGICNVHFNQGGTSDYYPSVEVSSSTQATAIIKQNQTITITRPAPPSAPCDGTFDVSATATSGLGVIITTSGACTGGGTGFATITMTSSTGICYVHYNQPGDFYNNAAAQMSSATTAHPPMQVITFEPLADKTAGDAPFQLSATTTSEMPVSFISLTPEICTVSGNTVTLTGKAGVCTIRATQAGDETCCAAVPVERSFPVRPAAARVFTVTAPTTATAGALFDVLVTAKDLYGNVVTGYVGSVHFTSSDRNTGIILPIDYTFTESDQGSHLFMGVVLKTAGAQTVTVTDTTVSSISGTSGSITINPAGSTALRVTAPATATAGVPIEVVLTIEDMFGNVVTDYVGTVHLTSTDAKAELPADYTFVPEDLGVKALTVTLKTAEDQTVSAAASAFAGTSGSIRVGHGAAGGILFARQPESVAIGQLMDPAPKVKVVDLYGNLVDDSTAPIMVVLGNASGATLSGTTTVNAVKGVATFADLSIDWVGTGYTLNASTDHWAATSDPFAVIYGAVHHFAVSHIGTQKTGVPFSIVITAKDAFDNTVATFSGTAALSISGDSTITPMVTPGFIGGIWAGDVTVTGAGSGRTITATRTGGAESGTSNAFDVTSQASGYVFAGFLEPVSLSKPFKLGSTIPIKFRLTNASGANVTSAVARLEVVKTSDQVMVGEPLEISGNVDGGNLFRVTDDLLYIYNLDTTGLAIGTYHIHAVLDDGTTHMIGMALK